MVKGEMSARKWRKWGLIFRPDPRFWWMQTHACLPAPLHLEGTVYRVFFASRDRESRSHVGYFDLDLEKPDSVMAFSSEPVLAPGPVGHFDDHGIYVGAAVRSGSLVFLYTIGWNPGKRYPLFYASIGLAKSKDLGRHCEKVGRAPILARSEWDPCGVTGPWVVKEEKKWRMWYVSGYKWEERETHLKSFYDIKYAESDDGISWRREGVVAIRHASARETNIARPCVVRNENGTYEAWFAYNCGEGYRIGFATSDDGVVFERRDSEAGIQPSSAPWENQAVAHPAVIRHGAETFLFYNGNQFGYHGVALATA